MLFPKSGSKLIWSGILIFIATMISAGCQQRTEEYTGAREPVRLAINLDIANALLMVASEKAYLEQAGLDVEVKKFPSGKRALAGMFAGEVDVSVPADIPIILAAFERKDFRIIGTISSSDRYQKIVARKDRGIQSPKDLKGKHIATQKNSAVHYFLYLFLQNQGMSEADIQLSFMKAEELPQALASGQIDAFSMREPFVSQAVKLLGENALVLDAPGLYRTTNNLVAMESFTREKPETIRRLMKSLVKAEEFTRSHPQEARGIVAKWLGITEPEVTAEWGNFDMNVSLSSLMHSGLQNGARWAITNKMTEQTSFPVFLDLIYPDALHAVRPEAVTIGNR